MSTYREFSDAAEREGQQPNLDDGLPFGKNYFDCGCSREGYYNNRYAIAVAIIGRLYGDRQSSSSDYKKGIAYIAKELKLPKRQVKSPRKKIKVKGSYAFKTPESIPKIVEKMISDFQRKSGNHLIAKFLEQENADGFNMYRTVFIEKQYSAIERSANASGRGSVQDKVHVELSKLTDTIK